MDRCHAMLLCPPGCRAASSSSPSCLLAHGVLGSILANTAQKCPKLHGLGCVSRARAETRVMQPSPHAYLYSNHNYSSAEKKEMFLEGTGSMVFDRINKKAYCSLSERTNEDLIFEFCNDFEYMPIIFNAFQDHEKIRSLMFFRST